MKTILALTFVALCIQMSVADQKRCFCRAVDAFHKGRELKDLGIHETHNHWLHVPCGRLTGCSNTCDRVVQQWVCTRKADCMAATGGAYVRSRYIASTCGTGVNHVVRKCGDCGFGGLPGRVGGGASGGPSAPIDHAQ